MRLGVCGCAESSTKSENEHGKCIQYIFRGLIGGCDFRRATLGSDLEAWGGVIRDAEHEYLDP